MSKNDASDAFDRRLAVMQRSSLKSMSEEEAAINTYERLRTARAIAESLLTKPTSADVLSVLVELGIESRLAKSEAARSLESTKFNEGDRA